MIQKIDEVANILRDKYFANAKYDNSLYGYPMLQIVQIGDTPSVKGYSDRLIKDALDCNFLYQYTQIPAGHEMYGSVTGDLKEILKQTPFKRADGIIILAKNRSDIHLRSLRKYIKPHQDVYGMCGQFSSYYNVTGTVVMDMIGLLTGCETTRDGSTNQNVVVLGANHRAVAEFISELHEIFTTVTGLSDVENIPGLDNYLCAADVIIDMNIAFDHSIYTTNLKKGAVVFHLGASKIVDDPGECPAHIIERNVVQRITSMKIMENVMSSFD